MLYYNTVNDVLLESLLTLMNAPLFDNFRLVGGTALSLQIGHRLSVDIDLFSDATYSSINFDLIDEYLEHTFAFCQHSANTNPAVGKSYTIGSDPNNIIKLDIFYTDEYILPALIEDGIRMATVEEIIAMKLDVVQRIGRKKDFWDLHELLVKFDLDTMISLHAQRYPYNHDRELILNNLTYFDLAEDNFDPICLRGKYWELVKEDIEDAVQNFLKS